MKVVASRLVCGTGISKTPVRAEIVTGTVMLTHVLAIAEPVRRITARADLVNMFTVVELGDFSIEKWLSKV